MSDSSVSFDQRQIALLVFITLTQDGAAIVLMLAAIASVLWPTREARTAAAVG